MKKVSLVMGFWLASVGFSHAENRIFPTDILRQGEVDAGISAQYQEISTAFRLSGEAASESQKITSEHAEVRLGLGSGWQIGTSLAHISRDAIHTRWKNSGTSTDYKDSQSQNPQFSVAYGMSNDKESPFSLVGEFRASPKTTDIPHGYGARLSAGWKSSDTLKFYTSYAITRLNDTETINSISVGGFKDVSNGVTLIPSVGYAVVRGNDILYSDKQYIVGLSANVQIARNTYLIPQIANYGKSSQKNKDGSYRADPTHNGTLISIGVYHLF